MPDHLFERIADSRYEITLVTTWAFLRKHTDTHGNDGPLLVFSFLDRKTRRSNQQPTNKNEGT